METAKIVFGAVCFLVVGVFKILEGIHHVSAIEERVPKLFKWLMNPKVQIVLLFVGLGLFADIIVERRSEVHKPEAPVATNPIPAPSPSGPATAMGDGSVANSGTIGTLNYNPKKGDQPKGKEETPKPKR